VFTGWNELQLMTYNIVGILLGACFSFVGGYLNEFLQTTSSSYCKYYTKYSQFNNMKNCECFGEEYTFVPCDHLYWRSGMESLWTSLTIRLSFYFMIVSIVVFFFLRFAQMENCIQFEEQMHLGQHQKKK